MAVGPAQRPAAAKPLELGFAALWRTGGHTPSARVSCTVENSGGSATVRTAGQLSG